jgi:hypothetical protein
MAATGRGHRNSTHQDPRQCGSGAVRGGLVAATSSSISAWQQNNKTMCLALHRIIDEGSWRHYIDSLDDTEHRWDSFVNFLNGQRSINQAMVREAVAMSGDAELEAKFNKACQGSTP